jgi:uncharacterized protein (TIGR00255 family)
MTAFGRGESSRGLGTIHVEITSLNRKHLEIKISLPSELSHFESDVRHWIAPHLGRGGVTLRFHVSWNGKPPHAAKLNRPLLDHYIDEGKKFEKETNLKFPETFWAEWALKQPGILVAGEEEDEGELRLLLEEAIQASLRPFLEMKIREGKTLEEDLAKRFAKLSDETEKLAKVQTQLVPRMKERIKELLTPYFSDSIELEERVLREVALLAERSDFTEEIIRLKSHVEQCRGLLVSAETQVGKTLEFLLQEMLREMNTIGSKAQELEISKRVIEMKSELEKIREQLQNVE